MPSEIYKSEARDTQPQRNDQFELFYNKYDTQLGDIEDAVKPEVAKLRNDDGVFNKDHYDAAMRVFSAYIPQIREAAKKFESWKIRVHQEKIFTQQLNTLAKRAQEIIEAMNTAMENYRQPKLEIKKQKVAMRFDTPEEINTWLDDIQVGDCVISKSGTRREIIKVTEEALYADVTRYDKKFGQYQYRQEELKLTSLYRHREDIHHVERYEK